MVSRNELLSTFPLRQDDLTIRLWTRHDVDLLAAWPDYPFPYEGFRFSFAAASPHEKDEIFRRRQAKTDSIRLVAGQKEPSATSGFACIPRGVAKGSGRHFSGL